MIEFLFDIDDPSEFQDQVSALNETLALMGINIQFRKTSCGIQFKAQVPEPSEFRAIAANLSEPSSAKPLPLMTLYSYKRLRFFDIPLSQIAQSLNVSPRFLSSKVNKAFSCKIPENVPFYAWP